MSNYFSPLHAAAPAPKPPKPPRSQNQKLLAQGRGPLKAPTAPTPPANTQKFEKATAPKNFKEAKQQIAVEIVRLKQQHPGMDIPDWVWQKIAVKTLKAGPRGDTRAQFTPVDVGQARAAGVPETAAGAALAGVLHPATDLGKMSRGEKAPTVGGVVSDVANLASNLVTPEKAGLAAGLFGIKGLKGAKVAADVAEAAPSAANATKAAAALAEKHGIPLDQVTGSGKRGVVTANDVRFERFNRLQPRSQLREGLKGARSQYGVEKKARSVERAQRFSEAEAALKSGANPYEAMAAASAHLRGPYAQIDYKGLKELNPESLTQLLGDVHIHPAFHFGEKKTIHDALVAAVNEGRVPRPHELLLIEKAFGKQTAAGLVHQAAQGGFDKAVNILNIPRALQTTLDVSGLMRQNLVAMVSHPVLGARTLPVAFKAMRAGGFEAAQQAVKENPYYFSAVQAGVKFTDIGEHTSMLAHDEGFQSDIAANALDKIPGVPNVIKMSAQSYVATGNTMRMAAFENRIRIAQAAGDHSIHDDHTLQQIAQVINAATGRGTLPGRAEHLLPAMNTFMFSPRLMLARLHYLDPTWYFRLKGPARREALRGLFALAGSVTGALYLFSRIPGVHVDWQHPQSSDWGKLKINNTRIDIAGGFQQYIRLASEIAPNAVGGGYSVSSTTGKKTKLGSGYGIPTKWDVITQFGVNKLAPAPGFAVNVFRGHDAVGRKLTWKTMADNYLTPLTFQDAKDIYHEKHGGMNGIEWALGGYGLGAVGFGVQTYAPKPAKASTGGQSGYFGGPSGSSGGSSYFGSP